MKTCLRLLVLCVSIACVAAVTADDKKKSSLKKPSSIAQLTCMPAQKNGTIICHISALHPDTRGNLKCRVDTGGCYFGFTQALKAGQTCLGAVVCKPVTARK